MKRLVICCDGTWNRPDSRHVTNIEKIARTVQTDLTATAGVQQLVLYLGGVGGSYRVDRFLGGAFGLGLFSNVLAGYRFLALNYEPGDEIFVLGFSRGAYTARSMVGMIGKVGLLTRSALVEERLPEAVARYKHHDPVGGKFGSSAAEFRHDYCHAETPITFLGVFDTVGALGVPGAVRRGHQFHDVQLSDAVKCARQALAADEPRMKFEPCLWEVPAKDGTSESTATGDNEDKRVRQVWFEGVHSDVGGGYAEAGLSDTALLWMVTEANRQGLAFDETLLRRYIASGSSAVRHNSMTLMFRVVDLVIRLKIMLGIASGKAFLGHRRRLDRPECVSVRIAESTADHFRAGEDYRPSSMAAWSDACGQFADCVEPVIALPEPSYDAIAARLAERGVALAQTRAVAEPDGGSTQSMPASRSPSTASDSVT
jgi:hypothetical protein